MKMVICYQAKELMRVVQTVLMVKCQIGIQQILMETEFILVELEVNGDGLWQKVHHRVEILHHHVMVEIVNIIFQMFTSFNNKFVQFILIVPIYMAFSFFIAPIWLGINQELINIYLMLYLGITILMFSFTNIYLERNEK